MSMRLSIAAAALLIAASGAIAQTTPTADKGKQAEKQAEAKKLSVGDIAPPIQVEKWLKGDPITGFEKGRVYVVEFWATWCGPCIKAFPHLSELQAKYKDKGVSIVGVNIWERGTDEATFTKVKDFVAGQAEKMSYTVAYDGAAKAMTTSYMEAAGRNGIPSAFIVDKAGKIAWMGHPSSMDNALEQIVAGTWDTVKAKAEADAEAAVQKVINANRANPEDMLTALDKLEKEMPAAKPKIDEFRWQIYLMTGQAEKALPVIRTKIDEAITKKDAQSLNQFAWMMVDPDGPFTKENRDLDLAAKAATKAVEFSNEKDGAILDTLARVHFIKGDIDKAIELQTKALAVTPEDQKAQLQPALDEYKAAKNKGG
jgi:thiol-disulfide isomerase/thioredoxin